jgi:hypothetical protein
MKNIKKGFRKYLKGMFALLVINLFFFGGSSLFQSCSVDDNEIKSEEKVALSKFENVLLDIKPEVIYFIDNNLSIMSKGEDINNEGKAKEVLEPILVSSQDLLISYGFTEQDLIEEFGSLENKDIIISSLAILDITNAYIYNGGIVYNNQNNLFVQSINAQTYDQFKHCLFDAFQITAIATLVKVGIKGYIEKYGQKALLRIVGKFAAKTVKTHL